MSSIDNVDLSDVIGRIQELEETVENQADRIDALEAENERLRQAVDEQPDIEFENGQPGIETLRIGGLPFGRKLKAANDTSQLVSETVFGERFPEEKHVDEAESVMPLVDNVGVSGDGASPSSGLTDDVREELLPAHEMWMDVRVGRADRIPGQSKRRAARLFGRFVRRAAGESNPVDASGQTYTLSSTDARDILAEAGDMSESGRSMTTKRAMKDVQRLTKTDDCDCSSVEECTHGVVHFDKDNGKNRLYVSKKHFNEVMEDVEAAIKGGLGNDERGDASDELDKIESADHGGSV